MAVEDFTSLQYPVEGAFQPPAVGVSLVQANFGQRAGNQVRAGGHCGNAPAKALARNMQCVGLSTISCRSCQGEFWAASYAQ